MAAARVSSIASVVSLRAKGTDGTWRDLTEGSAVADREEILCESDAGQFSLTAYKLQRRSAAAWVDAAGVVLDVGSGASHYRQDRISVQGDDTNSAVAILVTVSKGEAVLRSMLALLKANERSRFTLQGGATKFRGMANDLEHANKLEVGGFEQDFRGIVVADREQFAAAGITPKRGDRLTWLANGITYKVDKVSEDDISYALELTSLNK